MLAVRSSTADDDVVAVAGVAVVAHMEMVRLGPSEEGIVAVVDQGSTFVGFVAIAKMAHTFCFHVQARQLMRESWIEESGKSEDMEPESYVEWQP